MKKNGYSGFFFSFPATHYYTLSLLAKNSFLIAKKLSLLCLERLPFYNALTVTPILLDPTTRGITKAKLFYCRTQKTVNTWKISGILIVHWPITIKFRIRKRASKPQTNYRCCLRFSYLAPYWLISRNRITFHAYFWWSRFCEFHSN